MPARQISQNTIKYIRSLKQRKKRYHHKSYVLEGKKFVIEAIQNVSTRIQHVVCKQGSDMDVDVDYFEADDAAMKLISSHQNPSGYLAVISFDGEPVESIGDRVLVLDRVQDPGNAGSLIRTASWFGLDQIIFVEGSVDPYNPKVIQASAGAIVGAKIALLSVEDTIGFLGGHDCYLMDMHGESIDSIDTKRLEKSHKSALFVGNEGQGLTNWGGLERAKTISIPSRRTTHSESLNAALAGAIGIYHFFRK